jgi:hypothetical protein
MTFLTTKNPSRWMPPSGNGYVDIANNNVYLNPVGSETVLASITTQSGVDILTQAGSQITVTSDIYSPKSVTPWASWVYGETIQGSLYPEQYGKQPSKWAPAGGVGYIYDSLDWQAAGQQGATIIPGFNNITDNSGNLLITNQGNYIITTDIIQVSKYLTQWEGSGV